MCRFGGRNLQQRELLPIFTAFPFNRPGPGPRSANRCAAKVWKKDEKEDAPAEFYAGGLPKVPPPGGHFRSFPGTEQLRRPGGGRLLSNYDQVAALQIPDLSAGRVPQYLKANKIVAKTITDKPTFGGVIGPFSLAGRLFDMTEIMMAIYTEPQTIELLLSKCAKFIKSYIEAIKQTGVSGVVIAEPAAGLLSNEDASAYSSKYIREIVETLQDDNFMIVLHNCGNTGHCTDSMVETGAKGLHFGNKIDMNTALEQVPSDILVMGNLDPVAIFKQASAEQVAVATCELLNRTKAYKNFIISSGCDTPPGVSEANIKAFYSACNALKIEHATV